MWAALRVSRLEIRSPRQLRGHAVGARRHQLAGEGETHRLSDGRMRWRGVGVSRTEGVDAAGTGLRMDPRAGEVPLRVEDIRALQLATGAGRRPRHLAFGLCA